MCLLLFDKFTKSAVITVYQDMQSGDYSNRYLAYTKRLLLVKTASCNAQQYAFVRRRCM